MTKYVAALIGLGVLVAVPVNAQTSATLYVGYAVSEGIENATADQRARVEPGAAFGIAADIGLDSSRQLQVFYGQQNTTLDPRGGVAPFDIEVRYLHVGGTYFFEGPIGRGPYAVGGLGATVFSPSLNGLRSETKASLNVGFGYLWPVGSALAVRAELRAFVTLLNSSGGLFCSGGCVVALSGDAFTQGVATLGLSARF